MGGDIPVPPVSGTVDHFATLGEPRRPWLEPEPLKDRFLALSSQVHPDRAHGGSAAERQAAQERYLALNTAYQCLREPKDRLRHLLELERGARPPQVERIPDALMDLSMEVAHVCRQVDAFLAQKAHTTSPLVQVQMFERSQDWSQQLSRVRDRLQEQHAKLAAELRNLDTRWVERQAPELSTREAVLQRLEELALWFGFFARWTGHLQERLVQLSL